MNLDGLRCIATVAVYGDGAAIADACGGRISRLDATEARKQWANRVEPILRAWRRPAWLQVEFIDRMGYWGEWAWLREVEWQLEDPETGELVGIPPPPDEASELYEAVDELRDQVGAAYRAWLAELDDVAAELIVDGLEESLSEQVRRARGGGPGAVASAVRAVLNDALEQLDG